MSLTASWGAAPTEGVSLSTNSGWSAFGTWADTLDPHAYREVVHLWEHGYTRRPAALAEQLAAALTHFPPDDDTVRDTAGGLVRACHAAGSADHLAVDNGMGPDAGEDEFDDEAAEFDPPPASENGGDSATESRSFLKEDAGQPPWPGAVLMGDPPRWHNPHTTEPVGTNPHADTAAELVHGQAVPVETQQQYHTHMTAALAKLPDKARVKALASVRLGGAVFHADPKALRVAYVSDGGSKSGSAGLAGYVRQPKGSGQTFLNLDGAGDPTSTDSQYTAEGVYLHELGHAVDADSRYSSDPKWAAVWKREIKSGKNNLTRYARTDESEGFAELVRVVAQKGAEPTRAKFPAAVGYLESKGLL